ncbi:S-type pyocin domain-containing protein [Pseudomonas sp. XS1P51]
MQQEKNILVNRGIPRTPSSSSGFGFSAGGVSNPDHSDRAYDAVDSAFEWLNESNTSTEELFNKNIKNIMYITEAELAKTRAAVAAVVPPGTDALEIELRTLKLQLFKARTDHQEHIGIANLYHGHDPLTHKAPDSNHKGFELIGRRGGQRAYYNAITKWNVSYAAAYEAKFLAEQIKLLDARLATQNKAIADANAKAAAAAAAAQARAQAEAKRVAEEQARLAAEQEAQHVAAEKARIQAEADAYVEAQAKSKAQLQALVQLEAQERARISALNTALAEAEAKAEAAAAQRQAQLANLKIQQRKERQAQERERQQARLAVEAEAQRQLEQARLLAQWREETEARWQNPTFANVGSMAAFGPAFTGTTGTFGVSPATSLALRTALRAAVSAAIAALATAATPVLVGFAALLAPSRLGNGDLFSVSVPLSELAPDSTADLYGLAAVGGEIDLPVRLGSRTIGNRVEIVVLTTDGVTVPASVPVRFAHFDARKNVYVSGSTVSNGPVITWTPLVEPQDPSTEFPLIDTDLPIYEGATVTPDAGRIDPFPELDRYGFGGFITVFPIDSGIPPTFTMFRDRRQDPGIASGSGQSVSGNWLGAASTLEGAPIPKQIADKLRGREFSSFKSFRRVFWKAVASERTLNGQFTPLNKIDLRDGLSPSAKSSEQVGRRKKFEIHHVKPISEGGAVYDIDNLRILTPKQHIEAHSKKGEM